MRAGLDHVIRHAGASHERLYGLGSNTVRRIAVLTSVRSSWDAFNQVKRSRLSAMPFADSPILESRWPTVLENG